MVLGLSAATLERMRLNGWETFEFIENGAVLATGIRQGSEIHVIVPEEHRRRAITRRRARLFLEPIIRVHGYATTRIARDRPAQRRFVERLGFKVTWEDPMFYYYMLTELPFQRKPK